MDINNVTTKYNTNFDEDALKVIANYHFERKIYHNRNFPRDLTAQSSDKTVEIQFQKRG